jgi:hypothetical protein
MKRPRGRPFQPGNQFGRGRPKGRPNNMTREAQQLLGKHAEGITTKCIVQALQGDATALRLCMEQIAAPRRETNVTFSPPRIKTAQDIATALGQLLRLIARGRMTPAEGETLSRILESRRAALATAELEQRIARLEEQAAQEDKNR